MQISGSARGIVATSPTVSTVAKPAAVDSAGRVRSTSSSVDETIAMMNANLRSRVFNSRTIIPSVRRPMIVAGTSIWRGCSNRSSVRATLLENVLSKPVRSPNCPRMISTATPLRKPIMTALETYRITKPSRNRPASNCSTPTSSTSTASAATLSLDGTSASPAPAATDRALVVDTFM